MGKALVFFPQNPLPPRSGFHRRGLEILAALRDLGVTTVLASSEMSATWAGESWNAESVSTVKAGYVADVRLHQADGIDRRVVRALDATYRRLQRVPPPSSRIHTPPGMRRWFRRTVEDWSPDLILMNYILWDGLIDHRRFRSVRRAIDIIDLVTLNQRMWRALTDALPPFPVHADAVPDAVTKTDFFAALHLAPAAEEFSICDRYDCTIAITRQERDEIAARTTKTQVVHIPMTQDVKYPGNTYGAPPLFATGPNPFNVQGYLFFVRHVLPTVRAQIPSFLLQVTGDCCNNVRAVDGVALSGFVPNLEDTYRHACFAICPVFGLTGQQVKIVEAMAHGVPVVALTAAAMRSPIEHGVNGLVARDADEFADHVTRLWSDRKLCRQLGETARDTIQREYSPTRLRAALAPLISSASPGSMHAAGGQSPL
jgi:hypothetical protein